MCIPVPRFHHSPRCWVLILLLLVASAAKAPAARAADDCDGCSSPTLTQLGTQAGFALKMRSSRFSEPQRDYVETDAGECTSTLAGPPTVTRLCSWLILRGQGEVWNCPHSKSVATVTVEAGNSDSTEWSVRAMAGLKLKTLVSEVLFELEGGFTRGETIHEVTRISHTITPTFCHRVAWWGYFEVGQYKAVAEFNFTQRWAWWTKNRLTGAKVHAKGNIQLDCGSGTIELERRASIAGYFDLKQRGCVDVACLAVVPKHLGFFPRLPSHLEAHERDEDPPETPAADTPGTPDAPDVPDGPDGPRDPSDPETDPESSELGDPPAEPPTEPPSGPASGDLPSPPAGSGAPPLAE